MTVWKLLHILSMFTAVTLLFGGEIAFNLAARARHVPTIRRVLAAVGPVFYAGIGALVIGVVFGLVTALTGSWNLTAGWLLLAYLLVAASFVVGFTIGTPWYRDVATAASESGEEAVSPGLAAALADRRGAASVLASATLYVAIIADMVLKPFS